MPSLLLLLAGFTVLRAARRRPGTVSVLIGLAVSAGCAALGYAAFAAQADGAVVGWVGFGLAAVVLGCPAWVLVAAAREPLGTTFTWAGAVEWVWLALCYLYDPLGSRRPSERAWEVAHLARVLFGYWVACWLFALVLSILAHLANPAGSFR